MSFATHGLIGVTRVAEYDGSNAEEIWDWLPSNGKNAWTFVSDTGGTATFYNSTEGTVTAVAGDYITYPSFGIMPAAQVDPVTVKLADVLNSSE